MKEASERYHRKGMPVLMSVLGRRVDSAGNVSGYLQFPDLHPVPIYHTLLYGVFKTFWNLVLGKDGGAYDNSIPWEEQIRISNPSKARMKARTCQVLRTSDFSRPCG
jgi:hypothetical protein